MYPEYENPKKSRKYVHNHLQAPPLHRPKSRPTLSFFLFSLPMPIATFQSSSSLQPTTAPPSLPPSLWSSLSSFQPSSSSSIENQHQHCHHYDHLHLLSNHHRLLLQTNSNTTTTIISCSSFQPIAMPSSSSPPPFLPFIFATLYPPPFQSASSKPTSICIELTPFTIARLASGANG